MYRLKQTDVVGLVKPAIDVHTLGILSFAQILRDCGIRVEIADDEVNREIDTISDDKPLDALIRWIRDRHIDVLGFSYRLDPERGVGLFARLVERLRRLGLMAREGGPLVALWFAGLPPACRRAAERVPIVDATFQGDESYEEVLEKLGLPAHLVPKEASAELAYDKARLELGSEIIKNRKYLEIKPIDRSGSKRFGLWGERV
ncbi:MAG TPA: hypothetical protein PLA21_05415, partial [Rectinema sp.]|nr:hypothetical protein [Rectinema sp.]